MLGIFIGVNWFCSCITKEGMETAGAAVKYVMNEGVPGIKKYGTKRQNEWRHWHLGRSLFCIP